MSIYLNLEDDDQIQVASNKGWGDLCRWIDGLDDSYDQLLHLITYGWAPSASDVVDQLRKAIETNPPSDETVLKTVNELLQSIEGKEGSIVVTNGMGPEGEEEEEDNTQEDEEPEGLSEEEKAEQFAEQESEGERITREFLQAGTAAKLLGAKENIRNLKSLPLDAPDLLPFIEREIRLLQPFLENNLATETYSAHLKGLADIVEETPEPETEPGEAKIPPTEPPTPTQALFGDVPPPEIRLPALEESLATLRASPVAAGIDYRDTAEKVKAGAFAVTGDLTEGEVGAIRDLLTDGMEKGIGKDEFIDQVVSRFEEGGKLSEPHLENVFRTNVQSALSNGRKQALEQPMVVDAFPYVGYSATHDARTRPNHRALETLGLNGTNIYRSTDPVFAMFRPPWDYQCRCNWYPVTVEQAAAKGVQEAVEWLERAKARAEQEGGSFYQYLSDVAPPSPEYVSAPPFAPSPEFRRDQV